MKTDALGFYGKAISYLFIFLLPMISQEARAGACSARCEESYKSCADVEAAGCELGGMLVGTAAEALGNQVPVPGAGKLLGALAKSKTAEKCKELLSPCDKIRQTCYDECGEQVPGAESTEKAAAKPKESVKYSTLRIFSDRPRTIVYLNSQRMGATPKDILEPYVTPKLRVGKYWVKLISKDGLWAWEGSKDVEEGNVNSVEGGLVYIPHRDFNNARNLDAAGDKIQAVNAYKVFVNAWPGEQELVEQANKRIEILTAELYADEQAFFQKTANETDPWKQKELGEVYLFAFKGFPHESEIKKIIYQAEKEIEKRKKRESAAKALFDEITNESVMEKRILLCARFSRDFPEKEYVEKVRSICELANTSADEEAFKKINDESDPEDRLMLCEKYLKTFPEGRHVDWVKSSMEKAKKEIARSSEEERRAAIGRPQRVWGVALIAAGGAAGVTGGILGGAATSKYNDLEKECADMGDQGCPPGYGDMDKIKAMSVSTDVLVAVGAGMVVGGVLLYIFAPSWKEQDDALSVGF
jgi:hypothetical protein